MIPSMCLATTGQFYLTPDSTCSPIFQRLTLVFQSKYTLDCLILRFRRLKDNINQIIANNVLNKPIKRSESAEW